MVQIQIHAQKYFQKLAKARHKESEEEEDLLPVYNITRIKNKLHKDTNIATGTRLKALNDTNIATATRLKALNDTNSATTKHRLGSVPTVYLDPDKSKKRNKPHSSSSLMWWLFTAISFSIYKHYKFFQDDSHSHSIQSPNNQLPKKRKIAFVHIGKTGGSTAATMIRNKCFRTTPSLCQTYVKENLKEQLAKIGEHETEISLQVHSYFHIRKVEARKFKSFIVTVRHPVERFISWYNYFHPKNRLVSVSSVYLLHSNVAACPIHRFGFAEGHSLTVTLV